MTASDFTRNLGQDAVGFPSPFELGVDAAPVVFSVSGNVGRAIARSFASGEAQHDRFIQEEFQALGEILNFEYRLRTPVASGDLRESTFHQVRRDEQGNWWLILGQVMFGTSSCAWNMRSGRSAPAEASAVKALRSMLAMRTTYFQSRTVSPASNL